MPLNIDPSVEIGRPFAEVLPLVREALGAEGFGVLTSIDLQAAFQEKLGRESPPFMILGACNPALAWRALAADPRVALLLPCNVTVEGLPDRRTRVAFVDPLELLTSGHPDGAPAEVTAVATEARTRLQGVARRLIQTS